MSGSLAGSASPSPDREWVRMWCEYLEELQEHTDRHSVYIHKSPCTCMQTVHSVHIRITVCMHTVCKQYVRYMYLSVHKQYIRYI